MNSVGRKDKIYMGIKFSSIILVILSIFIAKISFENLNHAQAKTAPEYSNSSSRILPNSEIPN